jgi:hypothetical protein
MPLPWTGRQERRYYWEQGNRGILCFFADRRFIDFVQRFIVLVAEPVLVINQFLGVFILYCRSMPRL